MVILWDLKGTLVGTSYLPSLPPPPGGTPPRWHPPPPSDSPESHTKDLTPAQGLLLQVLFFHSTPGYILIMAHIWLLSQMCGHPLLLLRKAYSALSGGEKGGGKGGD